MAAESTARVMRAGWWWHTVHLQMCACRRSQGPVNSGQHVKGRYGPNSSSTASLGGGGDQAASGRAAVGMVIGLDACIVYQETYVDYVHATSGHHWALSGDCS